MEEKQKKRKREMERKRMEQERKRRNVIWRRIEGENPKEKKIVIEKIMEWTLRRTVGIREVIEGKERGGEEGSYSYDGGKERQERLLKKGWMMRRR